MADTEYGRQRFEDDIVSMETMGMADIGYKRIEDDNQSEDSATTPQEKRP